MEDNRNNNTEILEDMAEYEQEENALQTKSGYIAIVGKANAGKSTLLNSIIEQKVSIVSPKPQTTRNKILGIWTEEGIQMIFVDTPGSLKVTNKLGDFMVKSINSAVKDVNCILVVIDGHKGISDEDIALLEKHSVGWKKTIISPVARAAIRLAIYEIYFCEDIPDTASINEAIELIKKYDDADKVRPFVNGVLNAVYKDKSAGGEG